MSRKSPKMGLHLLGMGFFLNLHMMFCPYPKIPSNLHPVKLHQRRQRKRKGRAPSYNHGSPNNDPISQGREPCEETQFCHRLEGPLQLQRIIGRDQHGSRDVWHIFTCTYLSCLLLSVLQSFCWWTSTYFQKDAPKKWRHPNEKNYYFPLYWLVNVG